MKETLKVAVKILDKNLYYAKIQMGSLPGEELISFPINTIDGMQSLFYFDGESISPTNLMSKINVYAEESVFASAKYLVAENIYMLICTCINYINSSDEIVRILSTEIEMLHYGKSQSIKTGPVIVEEPTAIYTIKPIIIKRENHHADYVLTAYTVMGLFICTINTKGHASEITGDIKEGFRRIDHTVFRNNLAITDLFSRARCKALRHMDTYNTDTYITYIRLAEREKEVNMDNEVFTI